MSFSESAGVITQTGTDTNYSGMIGLTGVTKNGNQYTLDNTRLLVTGTLDVDRTTDRLRFINYADLPGREYVFKITGNFDNSTVRTYQNTTIYDPLPSISFEFEKINGGNNGLFDGYIQTTSTSNVTIQGMVNVNDGATTGSQFNLAHNFEGNVTLDNAIFLNSTIGTLKLIFTAQTASTITINNCEFYGHGYRTAANSLTVNGLNTFGHPETINVNTTNFVSDLTLEGMEGFGVSTIFRSAGVSANLKFVRYINPFSSIPAPIPLINVSLSSAAGSQTIVQNRMIFTVQDASGVVANAKIQAIDTDNGNRPTTNYGASQAYETATSGDLTYSEITDINGNATFLVTSAVWYLGTSSTDKNIDNRGVANTYDLNYKLSSFLHLPTEQTPNHYASGDKKPVFLLSLDASITETNETTIASYSVIDNANKFYDRAKKFWYDNFDRQNLYVTKSGNQIDAGSYNVIIDATASSVFNVSGNTITIKANTFTGDMTTTGVITLLNGAIFNGTRTDANGTVLPLRNISVTGLVAGSTIRIYNETTSSQVFNQVVAGTSYTAQYAEGVGYSIGDVLELKVAKINMLEFSTSVVVTPTGWTALVSQETNAIYNEHGVDGSTVTGISWDSGNMEFDFNDADNNIEGADIGAWYYYFITTQVGISEAFGALVWSQVNKITNATNKVAITFDNIKSSPLQINNCWINRDDGVSIIATTSNSIQINPPAVFNTSIADVALIKAKTDLLNFTGTDIKATLDGEEVVTDTASRDASKADVSGLSTFDPSTQDVNTNNLSREASKADTTDLATKDNQEIINNGVKKSSLIIPHNEDTQ